MSFYEGNLKTFNLWKMYEDINHGFSVKMLKEGISEDFLEESKDKVFNLLQEHGSLYYSFGRRDGKDLICANGKKYEIDDERSNSSQGIYMADAYFNQYEDINVGYLISYISETIKIYPAIEGESINCRRCHLIEDCGDLEKDMKMFLQKYMI